MPGADFLLQPAGEVFTVEDFSEEHQQIRTQTDRFVDEEVLPVVERYEEKDDGLARELISKCGELGLLGILVPEKYEGMELDLTSQLIVAESVGRYASFSTTYGAHSGIGTMPLVLFGSDQTKAKYLPRMVTGEWMAAYALSEPQAGSDALAATTRAELSDDQTCYVLNGQKMWISNGGWADLYTVFAKVDGDKFTAFLVERAFEGVKPGAEERKMGIHGSSTTAIFLDNVHVPVENVLGEVGRGHIIAFNILNLGRLKLGASCVGGSKAVLAESIRYAKQRKAFGKSISEFGAIQHKLAESAVRLFAAESVVYRIGGSVDSNLESLDWNASDASQQMLKSVEEYAVECSIAKVLGSETIDYIADEGVQIHGGYGFHQDYMVERSYRDARINRIFEGTNEINRLLVTGMILKRAAQGRLPLMEAVTDLIGRLTTGDFGPEPGDEPFAREAALLENSKKVALLSMGVAYQRFGQEIEQQQEVNTAIADIVIEVYSMDSMLARARRLGPQAKAMAQVGVSEAIRRVARHGETVLAASVEGPKLNQYHGVLRRLTRVLPVNLVAKRREIADRLISAEKYLV